VPNVSVMARDEKLEVTASSRDEGEIEIYIVKRPDQISLLDIAQPVAILPHAGGSHLIDGIAHSEWVGVTGRLRTLEGGVSENSQAIWRQSP